VAAVYGAKQVANMVEVNADLSSGAERSSARQPAATTCSGDDGDGDLSSVGDDEGTVGDVNGVGAKRCTLCMVSL